MDPAGITVSILAVLVLGGFIMKERQARAARPPLPPAPRAPMWKEALASLYATVVGFAVFLLVLMWPAFFFRPDIMLLWGWVGGLLGAWLGWKAGGHARGAVRRRLLKK